MALAEVKEPPPKPTRIRAATTTTTSPSKSTSPGTTAMIITQPPALSKTPIPLSRPAPRIPVSAPNPAPLAPAEPGKGPSLVETAREEKQDLIAARKKKLLPLPEPGIPSKTTAPLSLSTNQGSVDGIKGAVASKAPRDAIQRASSAPMPPPKPKRISLAPQPKAKPLSLQSIPLQPKVEASTRATTAPATAAMSSSPPATPNSIPNVMQSQETTKPKTPSNSVLASPTQPVLPPAKKPRSAEHPTDGCLIPADSESLQQRFKSQMRTVPSSSPPPSMSMSHPNIGAKTTPLTPEKTSDSAAGTNPTLIGARSRLRSTSDAKAATSLAVAIPYTAMNHAANTSSLDDSTGFGFADSRGYAGALVSPTFPSPTFRRNGSYDDDADDGSSGVVAAERLAASLQPCRL
ncbi:hypothetical protein BC939DRAFT_253893 [Gamsiella multidivaricata]|uniref:uncharacterized protein n=1 Tax=Gamsiella multidivaricata TaxID=101098 RepID=UPI0022211DA0|nr:uncharacterized protein BC939DRAFT_253893 [Gamsiella multidivaricata]KAI7819622.1 hypothetical protein BC939DRAFT_253893 [Gamsiella multidivaricata]